VRPPAVEYMESRGISAEITESYGLTTQKDHDNILVFPFFDENGKMQFIKYRKTDFDKEKDRNKEWSEKDCKPILFGMDQCDAEKNDTLILTEGQIDSLSVAEAFDGNINAVSVPTGCNGFTWVPYCWDFLSKFKTLIVFGDHEKDHITLLDEMQKRFKGTVKHVRPEDYQDCKDANELLLKHGKQAVVDAVERVVIVQNKRIKKLSEVQAKNMSEVPGINTGISQLDKLLGGFYYGQLIILTGERGLGKSTLGSQFIVNAIDQGVTTFCYSGELMDWMFQSWLDRQCAGCNYINTTKGPRGEDVHLIDAVALELIHKWYDEYCFIYDNSVVNSDEDENETILETIETAVKQYGCRMLMIDNLMTAIADDLSSDLYRQQSAFVRKLAEMAKRYDVIILLIVHPRKRTGKTFDNDEVAGSSNITNLADVVMNYSLPKDDNDEHPDRILQITKNRLNGRTNYDGIPLWYEEKSKRILEGIGIDNKEFGWSIDNFFNQIPDFGEEEEIEF
jgi:replicative DNA helicase